MRLLKSLKIKFTAISSGARRFLIARTTALPLRRPILDKAKSEIEKALMTWVNRNHFLMSMIDQHDQHVFEATFNEGGVWVNVYCSTDKPEGGSRQVNPTSDGVFSFYQKHWKGAIGATYAPFMTPVTETIYVDSHPLFSFHANYEGNWREFLNVDGLEYVNYNSLHKETA